MLDCHLHSSYSFDGEQSLAELVLKARGLGMQYISITDHLNCDYPYVGYNDVPMLDVKKYVEAVLAKESEKASLSIALGVECGYLAQANSDYLDILSKYPFDVVINSVHTVSGKDAYFADYFKTAPDKHTAYLRYLQAVLESLDAPYNYNIVAHIGYVEAHSPYADTHIYVEEFGEIINTILKKIIELDKCLEVNTNILTEKTFTMPNPEILRLYYRLGGRKISFASDAHRSNRLGHKYIETTQMLSDIGFTHYTAYKNQQPITIDF